MKFPNKHWRWMIPLLLFSADAYAWGLYTHVYFAQMLLWAVPFTNPRYHRAIKSFPKLVLAGACLPDLALLGNSPWGNSFSTTHQWQRARKLLDGAQSDEEYALSLGFASHLLVDVIAHNHFVPAHEQIWLNIHTLTHAAAEWAMDAHVRKHLLAEPCDLMDTHRNELAEYVARHFACPRSLSMRGVAMLAGAENLLRASRLPDLCYHGARLLDAGMQRRFNYYLSETCAHLAQIDRILLGEEPVWDANPSCSAAASRPGFKLATPLQLRHRIPLPRDLFGET